MLKPNMNYANLKSSYLFVTINKKLKEFSAKNPDKYLYRMGIGDVTLPLCDAVIKALHNGVEEQAKKETFRGYVNEVGEDSLVKDIKNYYKNSLNIDLEEEEVFVSSGSSDELGSILDLFDVSSNAVILEPTYPAYVDANIIEGREIIKVPSGIENGFLPKPDYSVDAGIIYLCSPNNPTGAVFNHAQLKEWVDYANSCGAVIIFDSAYEAFIEDEDLPHTIYAIEGAKTCAIEICSFSKTAGFTGTRLGYTVIPKAIERMGMSLNSMWVRNRTTKTNGTSRIIQRAGNAIFSEEGQKQIKENLQVYKNNAKVVMEVLDKLGIWYCGGKNSPYIWIKCPRDMKSWEFFDYLLEEIQVIGTPGVGFGECVEGFFRFSMFGSPEDTIEASKRLYELLK